MRILLFLLLCAVPSITAAEKITVYHTNDMHGWFMSRPDWKQKDRRIGGMAALKNVLAKQGRGKNTLLVDAGDWFQGTPEATLTQGLPMVEFFNALKYDAIVVGNHEYDLGQGVLKDLVSRIDAPVLGANVYDRARARPVDIFTPHVIKKIGGVKVGIFGLITANMGNLSFPENVAGLEFRSEAEVARLAVAELKKQGAEIIILLSHIGRNAGKIKLPYSEQELARDVPGIDLIISGHVHIPTAKPVKIEGTQTWLACSGGYLKNLGQVDLTVEGGRLTAVGGQMHALWVDKVGEDAALLKLTAKHLAEVGRLLNVDIGEAQVGLAKKLNAESPVAMWVSDCSRKWTKTQVVIQNPAGMRAPLTKGAVQLRHMHEIMPFDNRLVTLYMSGAALLEVLEQGISDAPGLPQVSGLRYGYSEAAPTGKKLSWAEVGGQRVTPKGRYSVTAPDFLVAGGDGFKAFSKGEDKAVHPTLVRDAMIWCAKEFSPIRMPVSGRIVKE
jgi:5'-nucleotidase/UDP-sugar diphosphatase